VPYVFATFACIGKKVFDNKAGSVVNSSSVWRVIICAEIFLY
jgi:hypothetical protein